MILNEVIRTQEFERILAIPRRTWDETSLENARAVTNILKTANGRMELRPVQAQALIEFAECGGLFAPIRVGGGKTLISLLLPTISGAKRPLLILPAKLIDKTYREWKELARHWKVVKWMKIISYESLSRVGQADFLETFQPDLVICDEVHKVKNRKAAVTRRLFRFLNNNVGVAFVALSGTVTKRSILDYHHILSRTHNATAPVPKGYHEAEKWAEALDNRVILQRPKPGALLLLSGSGPTDLEIARDGYRKRLVETCGVVTLSENKLGTSLTYTKIPTTPAPAVQKALATLRETWETPDGWPLTDPMSVWRHSRELLMGFYYRWDPRPPREWLDARRAWSSFVRDTIKKSHKLDSELQVAKAFPTLPELVAWREIKKTFEPTSVATWLDNTFVQSIPQLNISEGTLIWVEHMAVGLELSKISGLPFFKQGDVGIEKLQGAPAIVSIQSNAEGKNLQAWRRNVVTSPPPNGSIWEQMVGRTHREGQESEEVTVEILVCGELHEEAIAKAKEDARYIQQSTGQEQKILYGDWL